MSSGMNVQCIPFGLIFDCHWIEPQGGVGFSFERYLCNNRAQVHVVFKFVTDQGVREKLLIS